MRLVDDSNNIRPGLRDCPSIRYPLRQSPTPPRSQRHSLTVLTIMALLILFCGVGVSREPSWSLCAFSEFIYESALKFYDFIDAHTKITDSCRDSQSRHPRRFKFMLERLNRARAHCRVSSLTEQSPGIREFM